jgi:hypothetical protein
VCAAPRISLILRRPTALASAYYAFAKMLLDDVAPCDSFVERAVRGLRLSA